MSKLTLNGNILVVQLDTWHDVMAYVEENRNRQITITPEGEGFAVATPLAESERGSYAHLYHRQGRRPDGKPPKPTGPRGGGPSGTPGSARPATYTKTEAIAA